MSLTVSYLLKHPILYVPGKENNLAYKINTDKCLKCGVCVTECPEKAIIIDEKIEESDGLVLYVTRIDPAKCTDCGTCVSYEYWCPAQAIAEG